MKNILSFIFFLIVANVSAQTSAVNKKADKLIDKKRQCYEQHKEDFFYYIQIYNGHNLDDAKQILKTYLAAYPDSKAYIKWENPEYKVWTGEYPNKWEVEKAMQLLRDKYPNAIIVYPKIR